MGNVMESLTDGRSSSPYYRWLFVSVFVVSSSLAPGCQPTGDVLSEGEKAETAASVRQAVEAFAAAERARDAETAISFLAPDFYMYADGKRADYGSVVEQIRSTLTQLEGFDTTWSDIEVTVLSRDHALVSLIFEDTITAADGTSTSLWGPNTFLWQRVDGNWRLLYVDADHYPGKAP